MAKYRNYWIMIIFHSLAIASLKDGFENLQWGKRILGRLLAAIVKVSPIECAEECLTRPGCLSFNYRPAAIFCELNYVSGDSSDTKPVDADGWIFSGRNTWPKEITGACKDAVCSLNEQCKRGALGTYNCTLSHCHPSDLTISTEIKPFQSKIAVDFNSVHKLECKDGNIQVSGDGKIKCQQNGSWTGLNIRCRGMSCSGIHESPSERGITSKHWLTDVMRYDVKRGREIYPIYHNMPVSVCEENHNFDIRDDAVCRFKCIDRISKPDFTRQSGMNKCEEEGARLVEIQTKEEWGLVERLLEGGDCISSNGPWWTGGYDNKWTSTGKNMEDIEHTYWENKDMANQCTIIQRKDYDDSLYYYRWKNIPCDSENLQIICEKNDCF